MKVIFESPYNTRVYPSISTGTYVTAYVKEMLLEDFPAKFVKEMRAKVAASGGTLLRERVGGMRAWHPSESSYTSIAPLDFRERPWSEVWQLDTAEPAAVLDALKYTEFYDANTIDRFAEFSEIAQPLLEKFDGRVTQSCAGGVGIWLQEIPGPKELRLISGRITEFNRKYFSQELPEHQQRRSRNGEIVLWFGET